MKRFLSLFLILALVLSFLPSVHVDAAIKISKSSLTLTVGKSATVKITGTTKPIKWSANNKSVATVSNGKITAKKAGLATITATVDTVKYNCKVTVKDKTVTVTVTNLLNNDSLTNYLDNIKFQKKTVNPDYTTTYIMTRKQQEGILSFIKKEFSNSVSSELPDSYESLTDNKDFTVFTAKVNSNKYDKNDLTALGVLFWSTGYQQFSGIKDDDIKFKYTIIDKDTGDTIDILDSSDLK